MNACMKSIAKSQTGSPIKLAESDQMVVAGWQRGHTARPLWGGLFWLMVNVCAGSG